MTDLLAAVMNQIGKPQPKQKRPKGRKESAVLAGVLGYLELRTDLYCWRNQTGGTMIDGFFMKFGKKGSADIIGLQAPHGRMFAVECKRERGGGLSPDQILWRDNFIAHGGLYCLARGVDEVVATLGPPLVHVVKHRKVRVVPR